MINPPENWVREYARSIVDPKQLLEHNLVTQESFNDLKKVKEEFDIRIPKSFLPALKDKNRALAKQFVPSTEELIFLPEELEDPIGDERFTPVPGITHRYPDRVLFKPTYLCGVYCRFCFRRYKVSDAKNNLGKDASEKAISYIKSHPEIWEVILTGGDPLVLSDKNLQEILSELAAIKHVKTIRFHTRIPSVLPARIQPALIESLKNTKKAIWVAAHMNCAEEFTDESKKALALLIDNGIPVVLQSVLLKGVNDSSEQLVSLLKTAVENRVQPYYLHYPDLAKGTSHFRIPLRTAIDLVKSLRGKISGLCIPHFMLDIPGGHGKIAVSAQSAIEIEENMWEFESPLDGTRVKVKYL